MSAEMDAKFHIQTILGGISDTKEVEKAPSHHPAKRIKLVKSFFTRLWGWLPLQLLKCYFALKTFIFFLCLPQGRNGVPCPLGSPPAHGGLHLPALLQNWGLLFSKSKRQKEDG